MKKAIALSSTTLWVLILGISVAACSHGTNTSGKAQPILINGAGSTFGYPIYSRWADDFGKKHPNVQINYQSVGSGAGIRELLAGTVDSGHAETVATL